MMYFKGIFRGRYDFGGLENAGNLLAKNAGNSPNQTGLIFGSRRLTWKELNNSSQRNFCFIFDFLRLDWNSEIVSASTRKTPING